MPPASMSATSPNGLTVERKRDQAIGIAQLADDPARGVGLDDVAAMDALLDPVAQLAGEDRGDHPATRPAERVAPGAGLRGGHGSDSGGHGRRWHPRIPRRLLR